MDIFTLDATGRVGKVVNGLEEVVWTERYLKEGEFKATTTDLSLGLDLPRGAYISHDETLEIIKILDHQIIKERGAPAKLTITGDTLEKPLLDSRVSIPSLSGYTDSFTGNDNQYLYSEHPSWVHAQYLIEGHLTGSLNILNINELVSGIECVQEVTGTETPLLQRVIERGQVYDEVLKLLAIGRCGLKIRRPIENMTDIEIVIYKGKDRSATVNISAQMDEIDQANYLFSIRNKKTWAFVSGKLGYVMVKAPWATNSTDPLYLNWLHVDASDIEYPEVDPPGSTALVAYNKRLQARGLAALAQHREVEMADITPYYEFGEGYNKTYGMGDIIGVFGDYGGNSHLRIEEFTWVREKENVSRYPTFSTVTEEELTPPTG